MINIILKIILNKTFICVAYCILIYSLSQYLNYYVILNNENELL